MLIQTNQLLKLKSVEPSVKRDSSYTPQLEVLETAMNQVLFFERERPRFKTIL